MAADDDSFLPRLQSVFYAVFDVRQGPKIVYQVPEGLIATNPSLVTSSGSISSSPISSTPASEFSASSSRASSVSIHPSMSPFRTESGNKFSPGAARRSMSSSRTLFHFDDVSKYIIPPSALCGRLVVCNAGTSKIIGFPAELRGKYERNYFRFNICFVFNRSADLSCYEPIVRKVSRVLSTCEEESAFLSSAETSPKIYAILEQLYEDLNSYSETSIPIDNFNSIELKIFPFYPNPPPVHDWTVPLALINLKKIVESNWDLTMIKVCEFIDGTNHVSRIAHLAHCDLELTRLAVSHLLHYEVIMTIDIFQYSNMYTLRKSVQWLADEVHVKEECGLYTVKAGRAIPDWPQLLHLYSRLRPGKTVFQWMQDHDVSNLGIDARRFTSFGVIKGFLRRIHRWPIVLPDSLLSEAKPDPAETSPSPGRRRALSIPTPPATHLTPLSPVRPGRRASEASRAFVSVTTDSVQAESSPTSRRGFTASAAEVSLEQLRARAPTVTSTTGPRQSRALQSSGRRGEARRHSLVGPASLYEVTQSLGRHSGGQASSVIGQTLTPDAARGNQYGAHSSRPRLSRSPSGPVATATTVQSAPVASAYPPELLPLLDGEHHTDELCTHFEVGWPTLERWLVAVGGGKGDGDLGNVLIIYR